MKALQTSEAPWLAQLPEALKSLRSQASLTQVQVAAAMREQTGRGISGSRISLWETGKRNPTVPELFTFLKAVQADPHELADALAGAIPVNHEAQLESENYRLFLQSKRSLRRLDRRVTALEDHMAHQIQALRKVAHQPASKISK